MILNAPTFDGPLPWITEGIVKYFVFLTLVSELCSTSSSSPAISSPISQGIPQTCFFGHRDISVICLTVILKVKPAVTVFIDLIFRLSERNDLIFSVISEIFPSMTEKKQLQTIRSTTVLFAVNGTVCDRTWYTAYFERNWYSEQVHFCGPAWC